MRKKYKKNNENIFKNYWWIIIIILIGGVGIYYYISSDIKPFQEQKSHQIICDDNKCVYMNVDLQNWMYTEYKYTPLEKPINLILDDKYGLSNKYFSEDFITANPELTMDKTTFTNYIGCFIYDKCVKYSYNKNPIKERKWACVIDPIGLDKTYEKYKPIITYSSWSC